jgi:serine/threonine-protein kinase
VAVNEAFSASGSRYEMLVKIASGGMATVFVGRVCGALGFQQLVAIKRPHPHLLEDDSFRRMLLAEANLASRIHHANVVSVRDVEIADESIHLVMDYVEGVSLAELLELASTIVPREDLARVGLRVLLDACAGLHAAHELTDDDDRPLGLVHRDVSPHNILVGVDGISRVVDFGIAKCVHQRDGVSTSVGTVKGKTAYMAPEYMGGRAIDRRSDVFAMGILIWEVLAADRLFRGQNDADTVRRVLTQTPSPISTVAPFCGTRFDMIVGRALAKAPSFRHSTMQELAEAIDAAARGTELVARHREVVSLLQQVAGERLASRRARVRTILERAPAVEQRSDDDTLGSTMPVPSGSGPAISGWDDTGPPVPIAPLLASTTLPSSQTSNPVPAAPTSLSATSYPNSSTRSGAGAYREPSPSSGGGEISHSRSLLRTELTDGVPAFRPKRPIFAMAVGLIGIALVGVIATYAARKTIGQRTLVPATTQTAEATSAQATASFTPPPPSDAPTAPPSTPVVQVTSAEPTSVSPLPVRTGPHPHRGGPVVGRPSVPTTPPASGAASSSTPRPLPTNPYHR